MVYGFVTDTCEHEIIEVLISVVEAEFDLFQEQGKVGFRDAVKFGEPSFCERPEALDAVDMDASLRELVLCMVDTIVPLEPCVHQSVIAAKAIGVDCAGEIDFAEQNGFQRCFGTVFDHLRVDPPLPFEDAKHGRFAKRGATAFSGDARGTKIALVDFDLALEGAFINAKLDHPLPERREQTQHRLAVQTDQTGSWRSRDIGAEQLQDFTKLYFRNMSVHKIAIFGSHENILSYPKPC